MTRRLLVLIVGAAFAMLACASAPSERAAPARLVPDPATHAALVHALSEALNGREVTLADDALTHSSRLVLEPDRARDPRGRPIQGRETRPPESFRLLKRGDECVLVHERTGTEFVLLGAKCVKEEVADPPKSGSG